MRNRKSPSTRRKEYLQKRGITFTNSLKINADDGRNLDNTQEVADQLNNKQEIEDYYKSKVDSINRDHRIDSNSAAISGVGADELSEWMKKRDELLEELRDQIIDIKDLADITPTPSPSPELEPSSTSPVEEENISLAENNSAESENPDFKQDSSHIAGDDGPLDIYDE